MKRVIEKTIAALMLVCATSAWAVTANVVWESDFGTTVKTGLDGKTYTLSLPAASWLQEDGTIKIGSDDNSRGATIVVTGGVQGEKVSILMEYEGATAQSAVVPVYVAAGAWLGSQTKDSSLEVTGHWWNDGGVAYPKSGDTVTTMPKDGYFMYIFAQGDNVEIYSAETLAGMSDASAGGAVSGLNTANRVVSQIALGGVMIGGNGASLTSRPVNEFTGLVIKRVAIFTSKISASEAAAYKFPSEGTKVTVTEANTSWETAFPSWDDSADNSDKTLFIEFQEGASLSKDTALSVNGLFVTGAGSLTLSGAVTASSGITIGSGATVAISGGTGSAITNYGTLNVNGCSVTGTINNYGTIATSGTTSIQNASSQFYESGTLSVSGETTLQTKNDTANDAGGLRGRVIINENARLISNYSATPYYSASLTLDLHGELALGSGVRWVVGGNTTVNVYSGGSITGGDTTNGGLDWRAGGGAINAYATSTFTAGIRARGSQTITVNVDGSDVVFSAPIYDGGQRGTVTKAGAGTWKIENGTSYGKDIKNALAGSSGTVEIIAKSADYNFASKGSTFSGVLKLTNANNKQTRFDAGENSVCFAEGVRPELVMDSTATYFRSGAYNNTPLYVRDLSGKSGAVFDARYTSGPLTFILDTQQTKDTEYAGIFNSDGTRTFALNVTGNNVGGVHTLTLSGVNTTTNTVTVSNYAKVKFSSNGKWANGIVVVGENGVLESQNSAAIAAKLKVEEGATLAFANGVQLAATAFDWSGVSNDGSVNIDLSDITPSATPVTLIASGVGVTSDKFTVSAAQRTATLSVDNGALKATFPNFWRDGEWLGSFVAGDDATLYISQDSTLTVSEALSLGTVTVVKEGEGNVQLTISGDGALTTGGWTIPEGVTVNTPASMSISGTVSGGGVLNIPANTTLAMDNVTCSTKVTVSGTLETSGTTTLSAANTSAAGSLIKIVSDTTTLASAVAGLSGDITIESGAVLTVGAAWANSQNYMFDHINPNGNSTITVHGTVNFGEANMWELGGNIKIKLYTGAALNGNNSDDYGGTLDWYGNGMVNVYGNASINCKIRTSTGANPTFDVAEGATLTITKAFVPQAQEITYYYQSNSSGGSLTKTGSGTLDLTAITPTKPITVNAGEVVSSTDPNNAGFANMTINPNGTFTLKNVAWTGGATKFSGGDSGSGTLRLLNTTTTHRTHSVTGVTFDGTLDFRCTSTHSHIIGNTGFLNAGTVPQLALNTTGTSDGYSHLFFATAFHNTTWAVRDLTGEGSLCAKNSGGTVQNQTIQTTQTQNTIFSGNMICNDSGSDKAHTVNLAVVGDGTENTHSLTIRGENTSIGELSVGAYAKVIFDGSGSWLNGPTTVAVNGVLESQRDAQVVGALTLEAGSTLAYGNSSETIKASGALTSPVSGKVTVDVSNLTIAANASKDLLTVGSGMNANKFSQVGNTETHMLAVSGQSLSLIPIAATLTSNGVTTPYATVDQAVGFLANPSIPGDSYVTLVHGTTSDLSYTAEQLATYNIVYDSSDSTYSLAAAQIDSTKYGTLAKAIAAAASSGDTVTLLRNTSAQNIALGAKSITLAENSNTFTGSFTGAGTIILGAPLAAADPARWAEGWTGTVELKDITTVITDFDFADYGNANSTVRANDVLVRMPETGGEYGNVGEINLVGEGLRFGGDPIAGQDFTFSAAISGTGKIRVGTRCQTASPAHTRYIFKGDLSDFEGGVDYNDTGWYKATIVFQAGTDEIPAGNNGEWGQIILTENTSISLGGEMYGPAGIIVAGSINVLAGGSVRVDSGSGQKIEGSGTITYTTFPDPAPAFNNSWAGEVHLPGNPSIAGTNFGNWGKSGSKIVLDGDVAGWIAQNTSVSAEMVLDGHSLTVNDFSPSSYSFSKISGSGNISFNHKENGYQPSSLTIGEIAPTYSGTVTNNTTATLNITTIALTGGSSVAAGTKLLKVGGTGSFSVGSVTVGGVTQSGLQLAYASDGVYVACASYDGNGYTSVAAAIDAAVAAGGNVSAITVLDGSTTLPTGYEQYYIDNGTVCKCLAYVSKNSGASTIYCNDATAVAMQTYTGANTYDYVMVLQSGDVELMWFPGYKIKNPNGATITFSNVTEEYTLEYTDEDGLRTYANEKSNRATTYTWTGADSTEALLGEERTWGAARNWTFVDSSSTVTTATRCPQAGDTVVVGAAATISLGVDATVAEMQISGDVVFCKVSDLPAQVTRTITLSSGAVLTGADATLTVSDGVTLSPAPTTSLDYYEVVVSDGTYSVNKLAEASTVPVAGVGDVEVIDPEEGVTSITVPEGTTKVAIPGTITNISGVTAENLLLKVEYGSEQTAYYTNILAVAAGVVSLDGTKRVTVGGVDIPVTPTVATTDPMTMAGVTTAPAFNIKTIPGLYYAVWSGTAPNTLSADSASLATTTTTGLAGPALGNAETVRYYKISVGRTAAEAQQ